MKLLQISALGPAPTSEGAYWILRMIRRAVSLSDGKGGREEEETGEEEEEVRIEQRQG